MAPARCLPKGVILIIANGDDDSLMLVHEDATEDEVCRAAADTLAEYLTTV